MSSIHPTALRKDARSAALPILSVGRRRRLLAALDEREGSVSVSELATAIAAGERGADPETVGDEAVRSVWLSLEHVHLPKLADVDLVAWDRASGTVDRTNHPVHDDEVVAELVGKRGEQWDAIISCLTNERRLALLSVLEARAEAVDRGELAVEVAALGAGGEPSESAVRDVERDLGHVHLPKLDEVGLVDYDPAAATVSFRGHPELPELDAF